MLTPLQLQEAANTTDAPKIKELEAFIDKQLEAKFTHVDSSIIVDRPPGFSQRVVNVVLKAYRQWWVVTEGGSQMDGDFFTFRTRTDG